MDVSLGELCRILTEIFQNGRSSSAKVLWHALLPAPGNPSAPVPFLHTRQQTGARLTDADRESLTGAIDTLKSSLANSAAMPKVEQALGFEYPDDTQRQQLTMQLHHRLLGLLYGVLAAAEFPEQQQLHGGTFSPELLTALNACGQHCDAAWWYPLEDNYRDHRHHGSTSGNGVTGLGRVDAVLNQAADQKVLDGKWWMHPTTWLTVRRLLMFLLESVPASQPEVVTTASQLLPMLWVRRHNEAKDDQGSGGVVCGMELEQAQSSRTGWFPDPVCFGITVFDRDLQRSVEIAGRLAWPKLRDTATSIRISPALLPGHPSRGSLNPLLSGDSAGGLLGCGIYTLTHGEKITKGLTASVALRLKNDRELQPSDTQIRMDDIECARVGGAGPKLVAAEEAGLKGVALHSQNTTDADRFRSGAGVRTCVPEITNTFGQLHRYLTRGFHIDQLVAGDAQAMLERWNRARRGEPLEGERHHLDVFVEPRISVRVQSQERGKGQHEETWETLPLGIQTLLDRHFIPSDQWLVITEDAGGGKTVLSWLLSAALSRHTRRFWVVRYEGRFPEDLRQDLKQRLQGKLKAAGITQTTEDVLDDLLTQRRVVVIYDALDQDNSSTAVDRIHKLRHSVPDECLRIGLRLIVTSRPYAVNQHHTRVFQLEDWRHCRLELFDEGQQTDYREQVRRLAESRTPGDGARVDRAYDQLLPDREAVADLLAYPVVQAQIRSIIESQLVAEATGTLRPFRNAGDLYWEMANRLLDRAFTGVFDKQQSDDKANLLELLAGYGYLMLLRHRDFSVKADRIAKIHREVKARFSGEQADWERYRKMLEATYLTDHLLLKENAERELSFPSLKMAEFFAGLYLGRYCDERVIQELQPEIGRGEWDNVWRFVAELPETTDSSGQSVCSPGSLCLSLQALFTEPNQGHVRPTESMFRAWQVLTRNDWLSEVREQVLTGWRQQFRRILIEGYEQGGPSLRARTAAEVVFEGDLQAFVEGAVDPEWARLRLRLEELEAIKRPDRQQKAELQALETQYTKLDELDLAQWCQQLCPGFAAYALCSDAQKGNPDQLTFMMGASKRDSSAFDDEKPWQQVPVPSFYMATACVTRAQYALFDPQREREHEDLPEYAPEPDCPMIYVNFHDGMCFALWPGDRYSLPSEVQWEGAAWGGLDRKQHEDEDYVIGVPPYTADFTSADVNFDGNHPLRGEKSDFRQRTLPVRFSEFKPNGFGLWQMSGNVWEYTRSEWRGTLQDAIEHKDDDLASGSAEPRRCVRGGSWFYIARSTRCSLRFRSDIRDDDTGIRLSRTK